MKGTVRLLVMAGGVLLLSPIAALADDLPKSRWQMLPLSSLFYTDVGGEKIVTAGIDVPCGATPLGALLVERQGKLFLAAVASRPLAACAKLPQRQYLRMPFVDSKAYKVIEPMRGDLDGMRVAELRVRALKTDARRPAIEVDVPCGTVAGGVVVMPANNKSYRVAAMGFKLPARKATLQCSATNKMKPASTWTVAPRQTITITGLQRAFSYRVLQNKVTDLRKIGVLQLRGIDKLVVSNGNATLKFRRKCFEVPVGVAVVPKGHRQALAVVVARYVNAPCTTKSADLERLPAIRGQLVLRGGRGGHLSGVESGRGEWDLAQLRQSSVLSQAEINRFSLGQLKVLRQDTLNQVGTPDGATLSTSLRDDLQGVVIAVSKHRNRSFAKSGWFVFSTRSTNGAGQFALRASACGRFARSGSQHLTVATNKNPLQHLRGFARQMANSAGAPSTAIGRRPLELRISSAF